MRGNIGSASDNLRTWDKSRKGVDAVDAVLKCHNPCRRSKQRDNGGGRTFHVIELYREHHDIDKTNVRRQIGSHYAVQADIAERALKSKAMLLHCFEMSAPCNEG